MLKQEIENRNQMEFFCIDEFVPKKHLLRKISKAVNFEHIISRINSPFFFIRIILPAGSLYLLS